jgi:23S rRNA (guanine745-N1)-methyltransferase
MAGWKPAVRPVERRPLRPPARREESPPEVGGAPQAAHEVRPCGAAGFSPPAWHAARVQLLCTVRDCHAPLALHGRTYSCINAHAFDIARSGYVNLLQPQDRRSKNPGDTPEAVAARRRFLDRGHAQPLVEAIVRALPLRTGDAFLDVGCGEGHHTAAFRTAYSVHASGIDISLPAIELAARRHREIQWIVANADRFLPYADGSFQGVASITARLVPDEFARVLAPGGALLVAIPAPEDVIELRAAILGERLERDRVERTVEMFAPRFTLVRHERVSHVVHLEREAIRDVMESSYRGLRTRERERLDAIDAMDVTLARDLLLFRAT